MQSFYVLIHYRTTRGIRDWSVTVEALHTGAAYSKAVAAFRKRHHKVRIDRAEIH